MTPEQVHGYLTAGRTLSPIADWAVTQVVVYGPGVLLVGVLLGLWRALAAIRHAARRLRELLADCRDDRPQDDLDTCHAIWNATHTREEKP